MYWELEKKSVLHLSPVQKNNKGRENYSYTSTNTALQLQEVLYCLYQGLGESGLGGE